MSYTVQATKEALAAISSLKRVLGIPNHSTKKDEFKKDEFLNPICHIYTPDRESAELMGELLYRIAVMPKGSAYYDSIRPRTTVRDTIKVQQVEGGGYEASMWMWDTEKFTSKVRSIIEKHISPDKANGRFR